jgi:outer membrane biosynthesis protein TonB
MEPENLMVRFAPLFALVVALSLPSVIRAEAPTPAAPSPAADAAAEAATQAQAQERAARPAQRASRSVQPQRTGPVAKLIELERRKNEWLRETFRNR